MPRYDYKCPKCQQVSEIEMSITADDEIRCYADNCNGELMYRMISTTSFVLNGSGWARDGYK